MTIDVMIDITPYEETAPRPVNKITKIRVCLRACVSFPALIVSTCSPLASVCVCVSVCLCILLCLVFHAENQPSPQSSLSKQVLYLLWHLNTVSLILSSSECFLSHSLTLNGLSPFFLFDSDYHLNLIIKELKFNFVSKSSKWVQVQAQS